MVTSNGFFSPFQARSQPPGSYLSIDDVSFDPSIDEVSCGLQRSSRSSLAGTSATSAADISALSITVSQRQLSNSIDENEENHGGDFQRSSSRNSVVSIERESEDGQRTPTTVTEFAVVHRSPTSREDVRFVLPPPFPTPSTSTLPSPQTPSYPIASTTTPSPSMTPTASFETSTYPAPPPLFANERISKVRCSS